MNYRFQLLLSLFALLGTCLSAQTSTPPNDPLFDKQWGYHNDGNVMARDGNPVGCEDCDSDVIEAWTLTTGSPNVTIAILIEGLEDAHPDFDPARFWVNQDEIPNDGIDNDNNGYVDDYHGWDFIRDNNDPFFLSPEGNAQYSIIGATPNNNIGMAGIDWKAKIMVLRIEATFGMEATMIDEALRYAADNGADIISMGFGSRIGRQPDCGPVNTSPRCDFTSSDRNILKGGIDYAYNKGVAIFAATGNDDSQILDYPAAFNNVMAVGAAGPCHTRKPGSNSPGVPCSRDFRDEFDTEWWGSNYGSHVDLLAPGTLLPIVDLSWVDGFNNYPDRYKATQDLDYILDFYGTQICAPFAAGVAGLMLAANPNLTNSEIYSIMRQTADDLGPAGFDNESGYGMVNAYSAVLASGSQGCESVPTVLNLSNQNIATTQMYRASDRISVGPNVNITQAVNVDFVAPNSITFSGSFSMTPGSTLEARLADPCARMAKAEGGPESADESGPEPEYNPWLDAPRLSSYPNPSPGQTEIQFTIPNTERVTLHVYDLKGERVATLYDATASARADTRVEWQADDLPNGLYFVRLTTASGKSVTSRVMLQR